MKFAPTSDYLKTFELPTLKILAGLQKIMHTTLKIVHDTKLTTTLHMVTNLDLDPTPLVQHHKK